MKKETICDWRRKKPYRMKLCCNVRAFYWECEYFANAIFVTWAHFSDCIVWFSVSFAKTQVWMLADDNDDDDGIIVVAVAINEAGSYSERKAGKGCCQCVAQYPRTTNIQWHFLSATFYSPLNRNTLHFISVNFLTNTFTHIMPIMPWNKQMKTAMFHEKFVAWLCESITRPTSHKLLLTYTYTHTSDKSTLKAISSERQIFYNEMIWSKMCIIYEENKAIYAHTKTISYI